MVYFTHYGSSRPRGFHLVSIQRTKGNEKKINEIKNYKKNQEMTMNNMKTKLKQNQNNNKTNKIKK